MLIDPLAKAPPVTVKKSEIDERVKSPLSIMPKGLLNKLTQEEILDLIAFGHRVGVRLALSLAQRLKQPLQLIVIEAS